MPTATKTKKTTATTVQFQHAGRCYRCRCAHGFAAKRLASVLRQAGRTPSYDLAAALDSDLVRYSGVELVASFIPLPAGAVA